MSSKRILILNGHPAESSLSQLFAERYAQSAQEVDAEVRVHNLSEMNFDMDFGQGNYSQFKDLEPRLETFLLDLEWAEHLVLTTPMWWGGLPATLKGLFDRALIPGRTFNTKVIKMGMPTPMLTWNTARVIMTSDTPMWFERFIYNRAIMQQIRKQILGFVGIKPTKFTYFSGASDVAEKGVEAWTNTVAQLGKAMA